VEAVHEISGAKNPAASFALRTANLLMPDARFNFDDGDVQVYVPFVTARN
jgi:hypothetical protein